MSIEAPAAVATAFPEMTAPPAPEMGPAAPMPAEAPTAEPTIFDVYGARVVTYFGITDTLDKLVDMCPVAEEDRDPAKMQRAAAKILQTAGVEVEERFLGLLA